MTIHPPFSPILNRDYAQGHFNQVTTLVELLRYRAQISPHQKAFSYLHNGETESDSLTYEELDRQAQAIAAQLQQLGAAGERAVLLYPSGLEFISAFFGCLYAGAIAVPAYPPRRDHFIERLQGILTSAEAKFALTTQSLLATIENRLVEHPDLASLNWLATDKVDMSGAANWQQPEIESNSLAFLQYTSGSTGAPKGVMVSHGNLLHNSELIYQGFGHSPQSTGVIWLPMYHDMGLIGGVIQPLYGGFPVVLLSPLTFLQKPLRWLEAISRYQGSTSGGPNFAYDLCLRKISPEQCAGLDLSSWSVAFSGAEPVRADTLEQFAHRFAPCGFRPEAFYPCYGMAETTLFVTGGACLAPPVIEHVDTAALKQGQAVVASPSEETSQALVGCGRTASDQSLVIADPQTKTACAPGQVGEIWVAGASVTQGYWQQPDKTDETFSAYLSNSGQGPFLRTGDLGFINAHGELFVTGRLKDVIVIRGRNHYPQDIEATVERAHPSVRPHCSAAFAVEVEGQERLVVVAEVERRSRGRRNDSQTYQGPERRSKRDRRSSELDPGFDPSSPQPYSAEAVISDIRQTVAAHHGLQVYAVLLLRVASIPKTSSGKVRRHACRSSFLNGELMIVGDWSLNPQQLAKFLNLKAEIDSLLQQVQTVK